MTYKIQTIILRSSEVREYDRIYTVFSREKGKMSVMGIGTRKPKAKLASGLEPITRSEIFCIKGRRSDRVAGVIIHDQFKNLKKNLERTVVAKRCLRVLEAVIPYEEVFEEIFDALEIFLKNLDEDKTPKDKNDFFVKIKLLRASVLWKAISQTGYQPSTFACGSCGKKLTKNQKHHFAIPMGVICNICRPRGFERGIQVSEDTIKVLRVFLEKKPEIVCKLKVSSGVVGELERLTVVFLQDLLGRKVEL